MRFFSDFRRMPAITLQLKELSELPSAAKAIISIIAEKHSTSKALPVVSFYGPMGIGKTTLIKEICRQLGAMDDFSSPTYSLVNEYSYENGSSKIYHIDLYRLKDLEEAVSIGIEEYLNEKHYCFIEWPELIEPLLPENAIKVIMGPIHDMRQISIFTHG
jgi:tRNA threonylcarbamoyladenosine biosynthesis protein TsaE